MIVQVQTAALNAHAAIVVGRAAKFIARLVGDGASVGDSFTSAQHLLFHASNAHCVTIMAMGFHSGVDAVAGKPRVAAVLRDVCNLFCLHQIERVSGDLLEAGFMTPAQVKVVRSTVDALVLAVRRQAVPLTDAFNFTDKFLNSALGR